MPVESVIGVSEIMKRETDTFVHGLPIWTNAEARIERRADGGWNFKQDDQIVAYTEQNTFCPGEAIDWTLVSTGGQISSPFSQENIPVNCIKLKTWTAGHLKISVQLKSGTETALYDKLQFLTDDYNEQFCFSEEIASISVRNSKSSGWYGMLKVFNLEGDNINYVCSENCGASTAPTIDGLMVSGGRTTQNGELWMAVANSCIMGETCILKPKWTVYDGATCISGNDCFMTEETCSKKDLVSMDPTCVAFVEKLSSGCRSLSSCILAPSIDGSNRVSMLTKITLLYETKTTAATTVWTTTEFTTLEPTTTSTTTTTTEQTSTTTIIRTTSTTELTTTSKTTSTTTTSTTTSTTTTSTTTSTTTTSTTTSTTTTSTTTSTTTATTTTTVEATTTTTTAQDRVLKLKILLVCEHVEHGNELINMSVLTSS